MYLNRVNLYPEIKKSVPKCHRRGNYCRYLYCSKYLTLTYAYHVKQPQRCLYYSAYCRRLSSGERNNLVPSLTTVPHPLRYAPCKLEPHPCIVAITKYLMRHYCTSDATFFCGTPLDEVVF